MFITAPRTIIKRTATGSTNNTTFQNILRNASFFPDSTLVSYWALACLNQSLNALVLRNFSPEKSHILANKWTEMP